MNLLNWYDSKFFDIIFDNKDRGDNYFFTKKLKN